MKEVRWARLTSGSKVSRSFQNKVTCGNVRATVKLEWKKSGYQGERKEKNQEVRESWSRSGYQELSNARQNLAWLWDAGLAVSYFRLFHVQHTSGLWNHHLIYSLCWFLGSYSSSTCFIFEHNLKLGTTLGTKIAWKAHGLTNKQLLFKMADSVWDLVRHKVPEVPGMSRDPVHGWVFPTEWRVLSYGKMGAEALPEILPRCAAQSHWQGYCHATAPQLVSPYVICPLLRGTFL